MKTIRFTAALLCAFALASCDEMRPFNPNPDQGLFSLSDVAKILSDLPLESEHLDEVYDAVSASSGHGYDEEYRLTDLFEAPGAGVGDSPQTRATKAGGYTMPLRELFANYLTDKYGTKAGAADVERYINALSDSDMQIYWPYSEEWNGKDSFENGIAIVNVRSGRKSYAVCSFNSETDSKPKIKKVFGVEPFLGIEKVFVVPAYMDNDVSDADLDEQSKKKAEQLAEEARELENEGTIDEAIEDANNLPEWIFPEIQDVEQAKAYLREYNRANGIKKGKIPSSEETIKIRLYNIYMSNRNRK